MLRIPGGAVELRDDRRGTRWRVEIAPFLLGRYPVTAGLHRAVTGTDLCPGASGASPVTTVSWLDAIDLCNQMSARSGLNTAYSRDAQSGEVSCDWTANGYRLPTEAEEWCWDLYDEEVYGSNRIFRSGGWSESIRGRGASVRRRSHPSFAIDDLGFRLARSG